MLRDDRAHPPPTSNLKVVRYAEGWGYSAREWEAALSAIDWRYAGGGAEPLKFGDKGSVWRARLGLGGREHDCVVKVEPLRPLQSWLRWTKPHRQWRGARWCNENGIPAVPGVAVLMGGSPSREVLIMLHHEAPTALEYLLRHLGSPSHERRLVAALSILYATLNKLDAANHDGKLSNVLVLDADPHQALATMLVDTVAIERPWIRDDLPQWLRLPSAPIMEDFEFLTMLMLEPLGCGVPIRRALLMRALAEFAAACSRVGYGYRRDRRADWRSFVRYAWGMVQDELKSHGDPTPKHNPLQKPVLPPRPSAPPRSI